MALLWASKRDEPIELHYRFVERYLNPENPEDETIDIHQNFNLARIAELSDKIARLLERLFIVSWLVVLLLISILISMWI